MYADFEPVISVPAGVELASGAIGRLDQALQHHPLRRAWAHRARLRAALAATRLNGWLVEPETLYARLAGLPVRHEADYGATSRALRMAWAIAAAAGDRDLAEDDDQIGPMVADAEIMLDQLAAARDRRGSALMAAADVSWTMRRDTDVEPGVVHAALPAFFARAGLTMAPLYGLAAFPDRRESREVWVAGYLEALARAADAERAHLGGLSLAWQGWVQRVESRPRRSTSSLPALLPLVAQSPALSAALVSRCLDLTVRGASLLLTELEELGVVTEVTGRRASKLYVAADLKPDRRGRAPCPALLPTKLAARSVDDSMAEVDAALARVERLLGGVATAGRPADDEDLLPPAWGGD